MVDSLLAVWRVAPTVIDARAQIPLHRMMFGKIRPYTASGTPAFEGSYSRSVLPPATGRRGAC